MNKELKEELGLIAKSKGLDVAEEAVEGLVDVAFAVVSAVVKSTSNKYDDMVWAAVKGKAEELLDGLVDKIDSKEG